MCRRKAVPFYIFAQCFQGMPHNIQTRPLPLLLSSVNATAADSLCHDLSVRVMKYIVSPLLNGLFNGLRVQKRSTNTIIKIQSQLTKYNTEMKSFDPMNFQ